MGVVGDVEEKKGKGGLGYEKPEGKKKKEKGATAALKERGVRSVNFDDWKRIDEIEQAAADGTAPRRKFVTVEEMLDALDGRAQAIGD